MHGRWVAKPKIHVWDPATPPVQIAWPPAVANVDHSCPRFLKLDPAFVNKNGNGHAFYQFNAFMVLAANNNLTAIARYNVSCDCGCNKAGIDETNDYFFGDYFSRNERFLASGSTTYTIRVAPPRGSTEQLLARIDEIMTSVRAKRQCNVVLLIHRQTMAAYIKPSEANYSTPSFRAAFNAQHNRLERLKQRHVLGLASLSTGARSDQPSSLRPVRIAVHIRRGEVYNNSLDPRGSKVRAHLFGRMTPVRTYMALVKKVAHAINTDCFAGSPNRPPIEVVLAAENAKVIELGRVVSVPDLGPDDAIVRVDSLPGVSSIALAGENVLDAFETLCFADVVIGSKSGFTALAAYLCEAPLFLTMPFWISYLYVPNVLVMTNRNTTTGEFVKFTSRDSRTTPITDSYDLDRMLLRQKLAAYQPWCRVSETASIART